MHLHQLPQWTRTGLITATLMLTSSVALAQAYPNKAIRIIVPTAAGGTGDMLARQVGEILKEAFKQPVVIENKPGANGIIATEQVVKAAPDGYTLLAASSSNIAINPGLYGAKMPFDVEKDLAPITQVANTTQVLAVHPSFPAHTVAELIALVKSKPNVIDYANAGNGSTPHLNMVLLMSMTGMQLNSILYKGSTPGRMAVLSNEVPILIDGLAPTLPLIQGGKLRALGVTSAKRVPTVPNIPAIAETVPGYTGEIWYGVLAPAGTPPDIINRLNKAIAAGFNTPEIKAKLVSEGGEVVGSSPAEFAGFIKRELAKWTKVIKESGAKIE